jgi:hypothetical protein
MKLELALRRATLLVLLARASAGRLRRQRRAQSGEQGEGLPTAQFRLDGGSSAGTDLKLELSNFKNVQYSAPISLGGQTLPAIYDTGSFEIIVLSTLCRTCAQNHVMYDHSRSTSFVGSGGMVVEHLFGSGSVRSEKGYEVVHLGAPSSPFGVQRMPFWQVISHQIAVWDENAHFSGIVGLGYPTFVPGGFGQESTSDKTLMAAMGVRSFAFCLERGREEAPGWLVVGPSADASSYNGAFQTMRVIGRTHWGIQMTSFRIQGLNGQNPCRPSCGAIVDSGTSLIAVPSSALEAIAPLTQMIKRDCSNLHVLPALTLELDGHLVDLPPKAYVMKTKARVYKNSSIWKALLRGSSYDEVDECSAAFMTMDKVSQYGPVWILGMSFLRHYYTVFDRSAKQIRIARSSPDCQLPSGAGGLAFGNASGLPSLVNATQQGQFAAGGSMGMFTAADYQPTEVDLNEARVPEWALRADQQHFEI